MVMLLDRNGMASSDTTQNMAALRDGMTKATPMASRMNIHCQKALRMRGARMVLQMAKASPISW